jgi:hypothetical protein
LIRVDHLDIAGIRFTLEPPAGWRVVEEDPRYLPFLNGVGVSDHEVTVRLSFDRPSVEGLPVLFDTGDAWRALRDGEDVLVDMAPPGVPGRLWTARLRQGRTEVVVYCGPQLVVEDHGGQGVREIRNPLRYPLDQIVMLGLLPGGLVVHGAGAVRGGIGLAFPGRSGAGKSTLMRLMREAPGASGLSDDRVALRTTGGAATVHGTPWAGDERVAAQANAPLRALVFLHQAKENRLVPIDAREALTQLLPTVCIPWFEPEGVALGLTVCGALVGMVPAYELHFRPEVAALSVLDDLW